MTSWLRLNAIPEAVLPLAYITASIAVKLRAVWAADKCRSLPGRVEYVGSVTRLAVYPVKSMGGITSNEAECTRTGLRLVDSDVYDR